MLRHEFHTLTTKPKRKPSHNNISYSLINWVIQINDKFYLKFTIFVIEET